MFGEITYYLPIIIRIGALVMICAVLYDYFKRRWANAFVEALKTSEAVSIGTAACVDELEKHFKGARRFTVLFLANENSSLRRVIKCVSVKREPAQTSKKRSARLTGEEKWYLNMPEIPSDDEKNKEIHHTVPYVLRDGGEKSRAKLIIGIVAVILFSELIIYFLPQIISFFSGISRFGND